MTKTQKRLSGLLLVAGLITLLVYLFDWNMLRGFVERQVSQATGRNFYIRGDMDVNLSWQPLVILNDISLGNAAWSQKPNMLEMKQAAIVFDLRSVFSDAVEVPRIRLTQADLQLEKNPQGQGNWVFTPTSKGEGKQLVLGDIRIDNGRLRYLSPQDKTDMTVQLSSTRTGQRAMFAIDGRGRYQDVPTRLGGVVGAITQLSDLQKAYPISLAGAAGRTRFEARGTVTNPLQMEGLAVDFELAGRNLADLYPLVGVPLPPSPPYSLDGRLVHKGAVWHLRGFEGKVGRSDLGGDFLVDRGKQPQFIKATLHSRNLDMNDLSGFIGARDEAGKKVKPSADRVLPDEPFNLDKLRAADMDVRYKAKRIMTRKLPLDDLSAHMQVDDGKLRFDPLNFGVAGGDITSTLSMNAGVSPMVTQADIRVRRVQLKELFEGLEFEKVSTGSIGGQAKFAVKGNSVAQMLGSANGQVGLVMNGGSISLLGLRLANLDLANALLVLLTGDRAVPIRCMVGDMEAKNGVLQTKTMVLDTDKQVIRGDGNIDFKNERLDLKLRADPKDVSLVALRGPIEVKGTFKNPQFGPDMGKVTGRAAVAVALGTIAPPLALIPLIELGGGEDTPCGRLIRQSKDQANDPVKTPAKPGKVR